MTKKLDIVSLYYAPNVAELLDEDKLKQIGEQVVKEYEIDEASRAEFTKTVKEALAIAKQVSKNKGQPGKADVMYPLITNASIQYASRTYPEIVRNGKVVQTAVLGPDPTGEKEDRARRVSDHMSAQLLMEDPEWEDNLDRLLHVLPIVGTAFKKTYWDELRLHNVSTLCLPDEIVVNDNIKSIETARRITHVIPMYKNDITERIRHGMYCDIDVDLLSNPDNSDGDEDPQYITLEQHRFLDLDDDGYAEPYIVTVHKDTKKVLRIYKRFDLDRVEKNEKGKISRIKPVQYFTAFTFIPSPDGKFYGVGFGTILLPLNQTMNTLINQLLDAGTLANTAGGFLGKGFKSTSGVIEFGQFEWKKVDVPGQDLAANVFPLPVRPPSPVLFNLLELMLQAGKDLSSVSDVLQGQEQTQNSPATTVLALIEQGLKVFSSIQKRLYRSLKSEFVKLYRLNRIYLDDIRRYSRLLQSEIIQADDYSDENLDVLPISDPSMSSDAQRLARAQALMQSVSLFGPAGQQTILKNWLEALNTPQVDIDKMLPPPDPNAPPAPAEKEMMMKEQEMKSAHADMMMKHDLAAIEVDEKSKKTEAEIVLIKAQVDEIYANIGLSKGKLHLDAAKIESGHQLGHIKASIDATNKIEDLQDAKAKEVEQNAIASSAATE